MHLFTGSKQTELLCSSWEMVWLLHGMFHIVFWHVQYITPFRWFVNFPLIFAHHNIYYQVTSVIWTCYLLSSNKCDMNMLSIIKWQAWYEHNIYYQVTSVIWTCYLLSSDKCDMNIISIIKWQTWYEYNIYYQVTSVIWTCYRWFIMFISMMLQ